MYDPARRSLGRRILDRAVGLAAAALVDRRDLPAMLTDRGVSAAALSPARFA